MDIPVSPVGFKVRMWNMVLAASCSVFTCYPQEPGLLVKIGGSFYKRTCFRKKKKHHLSEGEWAQTQGRSNKGVVDSLQWPRQSPDFENLWHRKVALPSNSLKGLHTYESSIFSAFVFCKHLLTKFRMNTEWILVMLKDSLCHL